MFRIAMDELMFLFFLIVMDDFMFLCFLFPGAPAPSV